VAESAAAEFQTYVFFLRHFCQLIRNGRGGLYNGALISALVAEQQPLVQALGALEYTDAERRHVRKYLFTSWNAEALARLSTLHDPDVRRFTNQWKPVQCYYAVYFQLVAAQYVATRAVQRSHEPTIKYSTNSLVHWLPRPWCCRLDFDDGLLREFPANTAMRGASGWNLANNEPYHHVACFLRRTGERSQQETVADLRRRRKRIPAGRPRAGRLYTRADVRVGTVSVFDVLWRFRTWANYHEGDTIIEGGEYVDHAVEFDARFNEIVDTTAVLIEGVIRRRLGAATLREFYDAFLGIAAGHLDAGTIARRRGFVTP
jgi:hypothetical protein